MQKNQIVNLGFIQYAPTSEPRDNHERCLYMAKELAQAGADFIALPELYHLPYFCQEENYSPFQWACTLQDELFQDWQHLAKTEHVHVFVPFFERRARGLYHNSLAFVSPGNPPQIYRKTHIPDDPGYYEKFYFTPGDIGYKVFATEKLSIGASICWDQWFPEVARCMALHGAELLVYPTAIGWHDEQDEATNNKQLHAWRTIMCSHAIANGVYVLAVNRSGRQGPTQFWGHSFLCDPFGEILFEAGMEEDLQEMFQVDLRLIDQTRQHWPFLRDRRPETYGSLLRLYEGK